MVLATALPKDTVNYALASSSAFAAEMASSLSAGNPPAWYQALPSDVKNILPSLYPVVASPTPTPSSSVALSMPISSVGTISARPTGINSTSVSDVHMPTLSPTSARPSLPVATANSASYPAAALGAGVGAALGVIGMLAL
jgi:hypothetical protein